MAVVFALVAVASVVWVLVAPSVVDDQGTRATFAGWALGILALLLSVISSARAVKRRESGPTPSPLMNENVQQNVSDHGIGNIGGTHFHGDVTFGDRS